MNKEVFEKELTELDNHCHRIMSEKGKKYVGESSDRLINFYEIATRTKVHPLVAWSILADKHFESIQNLTKIKTSIESNDLLELFVDAINYLKLGYMLMRENIPILHGEILPVFKDEIQSGTFGKIPYVELKKSYIPTDNEIQTKKLELTRDKVPDIIYKEPDSMQVKSGSILVEGLNQNAGKLGKDIPQGVKIENQKPMWTVGSVYFTETDDIIMICEITTSHLRCFSSRQKVIRHFGFLGKSCDTLGDDRIREIYKGEEGINLGDKLKQEMKDLNIWRTPSKPEVHNSQLEWRIGSVYSTKEKDLVLICRINHPVLRCFSSRQRVIRTFNVLGESDDIFGKDRITQLHRGEEGAKLRQGLEKEMKDLKLIV